MSDFFTVTLVLFRTWATEILLEKQEKKQKEIVWARSTGIQFRFSKNVCMLEKAFAYLVDVVDPGHRRHKFRQLKQRDLHLVRVWIFTLGQVGPLLLQLDDPRHFSLCPLLVSPQQLGHLKHVVFVPFNLARLVIYDEPGQCHRDNVDGRVIVSLVYQLGVGSVANDRREEHVAGEDFSVGKEAPSDVLNGSKVVVVPQNVGRKVVPRPSKAVIPVLRNVKNKLFEKKKDKY